MIWSWVGICAVTLAVAYSLAEMCSSVPVAGGQYSWVAVLAPKSIARGMSYVSGWFMLIGILAMYAPTILDESSRTDAPIGAQRTISSEQTLF
jgi:amino acid transporter